MQKLYGFYRKERLVKPKKLDKHLSQNGNYSISFYANNQYNDYIEAGLIKIQDEIVPQDKYTKELTPGILDLREFVYMEYNEQYVELELATEIINKIGARFDLVLLNTVQALDFIKTHTNLQEIESGKFLVSEAGLDPMGEIQEAKYLIIS